ncbi:MAG: hypothetical protein V9G12_07700 [Microthrixaceae bacterium]
MSDWPVIMRAWSDRKNVTASATSSSATISPSGMPASISAFTSSPGMPRSDACQSTYICTGGPHIQLGTTVLTRILSGPNSLARWNIAVSSAPLEAA